MKNREKREAVCRVLEQEKSLEFARLQERTGIVDYTLRYLLRELTREGRIERNYQKGKKRS